VSTVSKCKKCGEEVVWKEKPGGGFFPPENKDGSRHDCEKKTALQQPKEDARVGIYGGIVRGQISLTLKSGIMMSQATVDLLKCLSDPNTTIKTGMKIKLIFAKDGKAEKAEVCPDQPAPAAAPAQAAPEKPTETCTSPKESPAPSEKDVWMAERDEFCNLLTSTGREGMPALLQYLVEKTDFFIAPSSAKYHDARDGGLLHHSLKVYRNLVTLSISFETPCPFESLVIIGLLHDLCKANFYKLVKKPLPRKDDNGELILDTYGKKIWDETLVYDIEDQFPAGHGEKSVILILRYIQLTDEEIMAIRWHMGAYDDVKQSYGGNLALTNASEKYPITVLTHIADLSASFLEVRKPEAGGP
jgi:hypothetical protein